MTVLPLLTKIQAAFLIYWELPRLTNVLFSRLPSNSQYDQTSRFIAVTLFLLVRLLRHNFSLTSAEANAEYQAIIAVQESATPAHRQTLRGLWRETLEDWIARWMVRLSLDFGSRRGRDITRLFNWLRAREDTEFAEHVRRAEINRWADECGSEFQKEDVKVDAEDTPSVDAGVNGDLDGNGGEEEVDSGGTSQWEEQDADAEENAEEDG